MAKDLPDVRAADALAKPDWALSRRERAAAERARQGLAQRRRRWPWLVLLLIVLVAGTGAWQWQQRQAAPVTSASTEAEPQEPRLTQINRDEWTTLQPITLRRSVKVIGTLQPSRRADLSAETSGQVEEIAVRPGDAVEAGATLVQIDVERLTLDIELARSNADATRAQVALAEQQLDRQQALVERQVAAETSLDEVRTNVEALRANLSAQEDQIRSAEIALEGATVSAPFAGVIASRSVEPGAVVAAGTPLLSLVDLSRMEMLASAPVAAGPQVRVGQTVELEIDGIEGRIFTGTVARIAPVAEEGTRTLTVYVDVDNPDGMLLGGMFATGQIVVAEAPATLAVPREAVRQDDQGSYVLLIQDGLLVRRDVTVGEAWPGDLVQVEGVEAGSGVVIAALQELAPGQAIELVNF